MSDIYNVEFSEGEKPKNKKAILERFIDITVEHADDPELLHICGDEILLDTLKYILHCEPRNASDKTLSKIIKMFENNPRWYS